MKLYVIYTSYRWKLYIKYTRNQAIERLLEYYWQKAEGLLHQNN